MDIIPDFEDRGLVHVDEVANVLRGAVDLGHDDRYGIFSIGMGIGISIAARALSNTFFGACSGIVGCRGTVLGVRPLITCDFAR